MSIPNRNITDANGNPIDNEIEYVISPEAVEKDTAPMSVVSKLMYGAALKYRYKVHSRGMKPTALRGYMYDHQSYLIDLSRDGRDNCRLRSTLLVPFHVFTIIDDESNQQLTRSFN